MKNYNVLVNGDSDDDCSVAGDGGDSDDGDCSVAGDG
ncbi:unnamed protein product, partial [Heligmosomoides polygyrus]|uniref:FxLD family lantipeptide n=1 Tax=Heligmosomoides polygyrus TaxID=6339 RepID=A0A183GLH0_HELPZ